MEAVLVMGMNALGVVCVYHFYTRQREKNKKKQSLLMLLGISTPLLVEIISYGLLPGLGLDLPELTPIGFVIGAVGFMGYVIWWYGPFDVSVREVTESILSTMPDALLLGDEAGMIVAVNQAGQRMLGDDESQLRGQPMNRFFSPEDIITRESDHDLGARMITRNGAQVPVSLSRTEIAGESGEARGFVLVARDITERKNAESALNMRDEEFRALVEHSSDLIVRFDTRQRLTFCNSAFLKRYNLTWRNVSGKTCAGAGLPAKLTSTWSDSLLEVMSTGVEKSLDLREKTADGHDYFNVRFTPEQDENRRVATVLTVARDISEHIKNETALRQRENRYHIIFNQSVDVLIHLGGNARIRDLNQRALDLTGLRREELVGKRISALAGLFTKTSIARMVKAFSIRKMGMEVKPYEVEAKMPDGRRLFFEIDGTPLIDDNGRNIGEIAVMRDITASKKNSEKVIAQSRALSVRNQELTGLVEISTTMSTTMKIEELLNRTLEKLIGMSILGIRPEGGIFLVEGDRLRLAAAKNVNERFRQLHEDLRIGQCLCGLAARDGELILSSNNEQEARHTILNDTWKPHGDIILPLKAIDTILGVMFLHTEPNVDLGERKLELLRSVGSQLGVAINNALQFERTRKQSLHDPLTGLANRNLMEPELEKAMARCRRSGMPLSLLMLDLDFFKRFNDTYGHGAGDDLLVSLARILEQEIREVDLIVRYGGEEFLVIMPDTASDVAVRTADRIRSVVDSTIFPAGDGRQANITVSIGAVTSVDGSESQDILMARADTALYLAKERGRNRVEQWVKSPA
ncbi:MAG: diguanylate cyclase [Thermoleophilia bacterium]